MPIENIAYILTFVVTAGITVLGILSSYNLFQAQKKPELQLLLYQQIFLFSFFIYGIWGNIAIRETISGLDIPAGFSDKLTLLVPAIGIPFMVISWFMLIKFIYRLNGYNLHRITVISYFVVFFTMLFTVAFLVQNQLIKLPVNPLVFVVRLLVLLNFIVHLVLIYPVINPKKNSTASFSTKPFQKIIAFYFTGVVVYSLLLWFFEIFGFISTCISILVLFAVSVSVPVFIKLYPTRLFQTEKTDNIDFNAFCTLYEISNREAEIILEICSGKSNKAIAEKLFITLQTVKDHNHRIYTKTQVKSRVQLTNLVHEKTGKTPLPNKV